MGGHYFVLTVESDEEARHQLNQHLGREGKLDLSEADSCAAVRQICASSEKRVDVILLAVSLPDGDGIAFCQELRRKGVKIPIIMMTMSHEEDHIVQVLDAGANDCVVKPLRFKEVLARLRAQLRAFDNSEDVIFDIGPYVFRPAHKQLIDPAGRRRIHLTEKETAILKYLYRAEHHPVARQVLLDKVWGYNAAVTTHTLETHIYRLRQKIEPNPNQASLLVTQGGGYCLSANRGGA